MLNEAQIKNSKPKDKKFIERQQGALSPRRPVGA